MDIKGIKKSIGLDEALDRTTARIDERKWLLSEVDRLTTKKDTAHAEVEKLRGLLDLERDLCEAHAALWGMYCAAGNLAADVERICDPAIKRLSMENGTLDVAFDAPELGRLFAIHFWDLLNENNAKNYVEMSFAAPETPLKRVIVNVRRVFGKSPDDLRVEAEQERDRLRSLVAKCRPVVELVRAWQTTLEGTHAHAVIDADLRVMPLPAMEGGE